MQPLNRADINIRYYFVSVANIFILSWLFEQKILWCYFSCWILDHQPRPGTNLFWIASLSGNHSWRKIGTAPPWEWEDILKAVLEKLWKGKPCFPTAQSSTTCAPCTSGGTWGLCRVHSSNIGCPMPSHFPAGAGCIAFWKTVVLTEAGSCHRCLFIIHIAILRTPLTW